MKLVKGRLFKIIIDNYEFPVLTTNEERALTFYVTIFPNQGIELSDLILVDRIYSRNTLDEKFREVKKAWADLNLLQAEPGTIKFNKYALDLLLENNKIVLTNKG